MPASTSMHHFVRTLAAALCLLVAIAAAHDHHHGHGHRSGHDHTRCGTTQSPDPEQENAFKLAVQAQGNRRRLGDTTIAVHFFVIGDEATPCSVVTTEQQITDQMTVLNSDFASTPFDFELASWSTHCNTEWNQHDIGTLAADDMMKTLRIGGRATMNVYVTESNQYAGALGYATLPFGSSLYKDAVVVDHGTLPGGSINSYNLGKTLTHEVGHWLGLYHTFEGGCFSEGDYVDDTPHQGESTSGCPDPATADTCPSPGNDPINNFMDYSTDTCLTEFSDGQSYRMENMWIIYRSCDLLCDSDWPECDGSPGSCAHTQACVGGYCYSCSGYGDNLCTAPEVLATCGDGERTCQNPSSCSASYGSCGEADYCASGTCTPCVNITDAEACPSGSEVVDNCGFGVWECVVESALGACDGSLGSCGAREFCDAGDSMCKQCDEFSCATPGDLVDSCGSGLSSCVTPECDGSFGSCTANQVCVSYKCVECADAECPFNFELQSCGSGQAACLQCQDPIPGFADIDENSCTWYQQDADRCADAALKTNSGGVNANDACCVCQASSATCNCATAAATTASVATTPAPAAPATTPTASTPSSSTTTAASSSSAAASSAAAATDAASSAATLGTSAAAASPSTTAAPSAASSAAAPTPGTSADSGSGSAASTAAPVVATPAPEVTCPAGEFKSGDSCLGCPANSNSAVGSTSPQDCSCNSGFTRSGIDSQCTAFKQATSKMAGITIQQFTETAQKTFCDGVLAVVAGAQVCTVTDVTEVGSGRRRLLATSLEISYILSGFESVEDAVAAVEAFADDPAAQQQLLTILKEDPAFAAVTSFAVTADAEPVAAPVDYTASNWVGIIVGGFLALVLFAILCVTFPWPGSKPSPAIPVGKVVDDDQA